MLRFLCAVTALALLPLAGVAENLTPRAVGVYDGDTITVKLDQFFNTLQRPDSPNNWLLAPADFVLKPDAVAPVFGAPVSALRDTFKSVVLRSKRLAVVEESANSMHVVATTPLLKFKDDARVRFIPLAQRQSTIALYSASRVGYWDMGTNRRRLEKWIDQIQDALAGRKK